MLKLLSKNPKERFLTHGTDQRESTQGLDIETAAEQDNENRPVVSIFERLTTGRLKGGGTIERFARLQTPEICWMSRLAED